MKSKYLQNKKKKMSFLALSAPEKDLKMKNYVKKTVISANSATGTTSTAQAAALPHNQFLISSV